MTASTSPPPSFCVSECPATTAVASLRSGAESDHVHGLAGYDPPMESHTESGSTSATESTVRTFPAWVRLSAIGAMAILICAVIAGMFLY